MTMTNITHNNYTFEKPDNFRRLSLVVVVIAFIIVYALTNVPSLTFLLYPLQLFTTYVHEAGHGLAAIATGGRIIEFVVSADTSGYARTAGGWGWIVLPAGYVGTALFGSLLFYFTNRFPRLANPIAASLGVFMIGFTVLFARPDETGLPLALMLGVGFGLALVVLGLRARPWITMLILNVFAMTTGLEAFFKLRYLISASGSRGNVVDDVSAFARDYAPLMPRWMVAASWAAIAVLLFSMAFYYGAWKPFRREIDNAYARV